MKTFLLRKFLLVSLFSCILSLPNLSACDSFDLDYTFTCATAGDMVTVTWTSVGCDPGSLVDISLIDVTANAIAQYYPGETNSGSLTITLGAGLAPGPYQLYIQYAPAWPPEAWDYGINFDIKAAAPVQWGSFECRESDDNVELNWSTFAEVNNDGFEVQHSTDGNNWEVLDFINGQGNSADINTYYYTHENPQNNLNYYRLKQMDFDGSFDYSQMNSVNLERKRDLKVYPTVVERALTLDFGTPTTGEVEIYDIEGRRLLSQNMDGMKERYTIDVSQIGVNILFVSVEVEGERITKKILKK